MDPEVVIVGQGLAGSALAWRLWQRDVPVWVIDRGGVDRHGRPSASRVAAGLITPISGQRLTLADDFDSLYESATSFYREIEVSTGQQFLEQRSAVRIFSTNAERTLFGDRIVEGRYAMHARFAEPGEIPSCLRSGFGGFAMARAARLRVDRFLSATSDWLASDGRLFRRTIGGGRDWHGLLRAHPLVVSCQGYARLPRSLSELDLAPAKGEVLTIATQALTTKRVLHSGVWFAPVGLPGLFRIGSTYDWDSLNSEPTEGGRAELVAKLHSAGLADFTIVDHQAAVRPATSNRRPTYGFCEGMPRLGWLNGLGAKGSLWAPYYADRMADLVVQKLAE